MADRPILFSAPMVRAILAGTKTQTRRVLKAEPPPGAQRVICPFRDERLQWAATDPHDMEQGQLVLGEAPRCPYGQPGDRLWVREAFMHEPADYCWEASVSIPCKPASTSYRADFGNEATGAGWKPSIHMPRALSRITLEITDVRVERLQDISDADAQAEGPAGHPDGPWHAFRSLWTLINGAGAWESNPWVWVVSFKRLP